MCENESEFVRSIIYVLHIKSLLFHFIWHLMALSAPKFSRTVVFILFTAGTSIYVRVYLVSHCVKSKLNLVDDYINKNSFTSPPPPRHINENEID